jgi:hypothetical protein
MNLLRLLKNDIRQGLLKHFVFFLTAALVMVCILVTFRQVVRSDGIYTYGTVLDYYMYGMRGMEKYNLTKTSIFKIPVYWFVFNIMLAYIVGHYAEKDLKTYGVYSLMAGKSRMDWWLSKCIWCIICVLLYYVIAFVSAMLFALCSNAEFSLNATVDVMRFYGPGIIFMSKKEILLCVFASPFLMSCAISLLQMLCSIIFGSVASFAGTCIVFICSAYYTKPYWLGNYTMWMRNNKASMDSSIYSDYGILIAAIIIAVSVMIGIIYIDRRDIFNNGGDSC